MTRLRKCLYPGAPRHSGRGRKGHLSPRVYPSPLCLPRPRGRSGMDLAPRGYWESVWYTRYKYWWPALTTPSPPLLETFVPQVIVSILATGRRPRVHGSYHRPGCSIIKSVHLSARMWYPFAKQPGPWNPRPRYDVPCGRRSSQCHGLQGRASPQRAQANRRPVPQRAVCSCATS